MRGPPCGFFLFRAPEKKESGESERRRFQANVLKGKQRDGSRQEKSRIAAYSGPSAMTEGLLAAGRHRSYRNIVPKG